MSEEKASAYEQLQQQLAERDEQLRCAWMRVGELDAIVTLKNRQLANMAKLIPPAKAEQDGSE